MQQISDFIDNNKKTIFILLLVFFSFISFIYYYHFSAHLAYGDAVSRLNIARKLADNLTPGFAQIGNVWLPFPQLLMLPWILNSTLWHTGIAGAIVSMISYIIGGYFVYKLSYLLTNSFFGSFLAFLVYALNINILYFQTTAMSEPIFVAFLCAIMYFFVSWAKTGRVSALLFTAACISGLTLTRYEGLAVLLSSIIFVLIYTYIKTKSWSKAEGNAIIFSVLACLGFALWTVYLTVIFGDPLYWIHYYAGGQTVVTNTDTIVKFAQNLSFIEAFKRYSVAVIWMNGLIPVIFSIIGIILCVYCSIKQKLLYTLPLIIPLAIFAFMVLTLMRNTPIVQPDFNLKNILTPNTNNFNEFNIRYGLIILPFVAVMCAYLYKVKNIAIRFIIIGIFFIQIFTYFKTTFTIIYQTPYRLIANGSTSVGNDKTTIWLKNHYDNGLILVSALKHDPSMFRIGINYDRYIHEGTQRYWIESLETPQKYAKWILMFTPSSDNSNSSDPVTKYVGSNSYLYEFYDEVYRQDSLSVYKIKTKPEIIIKN